MGDDEEVTRTTISMHPDTRDRLKVLGRKGETYDELLNRLIDHYLGIREDEEHDGETASGRAGPEVDFEQI